MYADERGTPTGRASRRIALEALRASGLLDEIEADAIKLHVLTAELADRVNARNEGPGDPF